MVRGWIYSIIGGVVALFAFRSMIRGAIRDYYRLPPQAAASAAPCCRSRRSLRPLSAEALSASAHVRASCPR